MQIGAEKLRYFAICSWTGLDWSSLNCYYSSVALNPTMQIKNKRKLRNSFVSSNLSYSKLITCEIKVSSNTLINTFFKDIGKTLTTTRTFKIRSKSKMIKLHVK